MKLLFGQKIGMTQLWNDKGKLVGVTVVKSLPNKVLKVGEDLISVSEIKGRTNKPQKYLADSLETKKGVWAKKVNTANETDSLTVDQFSVGDLVSISGTTKGKGFAGTIKRHNFSRGPVSHGSDNVRQPGSIGAQRPQRVVLGQKMPGHMGNKKLTVRGNKIFSIDSKENLLLILGAVPGPKKGYLIIKSIS